MEVKLYYIRKNCFVLYWIALDARNRRLQCVQTGFVVVIIIVIILVALIAVALVAVMMVRRRRGQRALPLRCCPKPAPRCYNRDPEVHFNPGAPINHLQVSLSFPCYPSLYSHNWARATHFRRPSYHLFFTYSQCIPHIFTPVVKCSYFIGSTQSRQWHQLSRRLPTPLY